MPVMPANGADLYYEEYGSGPGVVLSAQNRITNGPESYLELLAGAGLHVYSIQLRGFGRSSPAPAEPSGGWYPTWAEDVYQFSRALGVPRFIYTGISHGAGVGWNIGANAEGFSNDPYRQLVSTLSTEPDAARRKPVYNQLNDFLLDQQFVIVVTSHAEAVVSRANVQNVRWDLHGARRYADMWMA